jgi:hypothetical protein
MVSFRAGCFDPARGAVIYTLNLPDELAAGGRLDVKIELECS